ncbi:hypothetical protein LshimejAT787_0408620 [Lyophyllum shimeji]|uniref:Uncharacterized protein n=1 Tax=Lyophyllum shimeji TaxID=47721 RepID=A0A9P3UP06_LYOSH|nr:hypothetical protein LshimejAT787_0408620 [Lyophyllum shimeji]
MALVVDADFATAARLRWGDPNWSPRLSDAWLHGSFLSSVLLSDNSWAVFSDGLDDSALQHGRNHVGWRN